MKLIGRRWTWACAALGILCALLVAATVEENRIQDSGFRIQGTAGGVRSKESEVRSQEKPVESRNLPAQAGLRVGTSREVAANSNDQNPKSQIANHAEPIPNPKSQIITFLTPLGTVEKAGGRVEAIVEDEGQVYIVHEGEVFADKFKVLAISRTEVQVARVGTGDSGEGFRSQNGGKQESGDTSRKSRVES